MRIQNIHFGTIFASVHIQNINLVDLRPLRYVTWLCRYIVWVLQKRFLPLRMSAFHSSFVPSRVYSTKLFFFTTHRNSPRPFWHAAHGAAWFEINNDAIAFRGGIAARIIDPHFSADGNIGCGHVAGRDGEGCGRGAACVSEFQVYADDGDLFIYINKGTRNMLATLFYYYIFGADT